MLRNIQHKRCLTHGRTGGDQHQVRGLHTGSTIIQINESGGNTCNSSVKLGCLLDLVHSIHNHRTDRDKLFYILFLYHFIDLALGTLQDCIQTFFPAVAGIGNLFVGTNQSSEGCFLRNNTGIVLNVSGGGHRCDQVRQEIQSADLRRHIFPGSQSILQGNKIHRFSLVVQFHDRVKYNTVLTIVEILSRDLFRRGSDCLRIDEHRSDHRLFCLQAVGHYSFDYIFIYSRHGPVYASVTFTVSFAAT